MSHLLSWGRCCAPTPLTSLDPGHVCTRWCCRSRWRWCCGAWPGAAGSPRPSRAGRYPPPRWWSAASRSDASGRSGSCRTGSSADAFWRTWETPSCPTRQGRRISENQNQNQNQKPVYGKWQTEDLWKREMTEQTDGWLGKIKQPPQINLKCWDLRAQETKSDRILEKKEATLDDLLRGRDSYSTISITGALNLRCRRSETRRADQKFERLCHGVRLKLAIRFMKVVTLCHGHFWNQSQQPARTVLQLHQTNQILSSGSGASFGKHLKTGQGVAQTLLRNKIQTHKRFKRMLFIRTKHNMRILGVIPFTKLQNVT